VFGLVNRQSGQPTEDDACAMALSADGPLALLSQQRPGARPGGRGTRTHRLDGARRLHASGQPEGVVIVFRNPDEMNLTPRNS